jgi:hypothetical protein
VELGEDGVFAPAVVDQVQVGPVAHQQLDGFQYDGEVFFGTSLNEVMQGSFTLRVLDVDITAGLTQELTQCCDKIRIIVLVSGTR